MFNQITTSAEPSVIGVNNGLYQLEFKEKELRKNTNFKAIEEIFLNFDINEFLKNQNFIRDIKISSLNAHLLKNGKLTDIMTFAPYFLGYKYIVSQKFVDLLREVESQDEGNYHLREISIKGLSEKYYLFFVNMIPNSEINFSKSLFYEEIIGGGNEKKYLQIYSYEEYLKQINETPFIMWEKIIINKKYQKRKIISVQATPDLFFSSSLLDLIKSDNLSNIFIMNGCELAFD